MKRSIGEVENERKGRGKGAEESGKVARLKKVADEKEAVSAGESSDEEDREEGGIVIGGVYVPPAPPAVCSSEQTGPRLIITHIVLENFKSFQGRVVLGPFHKNFTSIIGPNGSGKSNVIDSMLFVFGYRASKIRSKKLSVLIHKSKEYQNLRSCTVTIHFALFNDSEQGSDEVIPNSQFTIARTAFADNSSKYIYNGKTSSFKEVNTRLQSYGIDLKHNRFLILQGEVEQIAMMKPKAQKAEETGMLEYLEDIIGTSRYKRPIEKLNIKVEKLKEECQEKSGRLTRAEKDREQLEGPLEVMKNYMRLENEKTSNFNKLLQLQLHNNRTEAGKLEGNKSSIQEKLTVLKKELKSCSEAQKEHEQHLKGKSKEIEVMKSQKTKWLDNFRKAQNQETQMQTEISLLNKTRKKAMDSKKQDELKLKDLLEVPSKSKKEKEELAVVLERVTKEEEKEKENLKLVYENCARETKPLEEERDELQNKLILLNNTKDTAKSNYEVVKFEMETYLDEERKESVKLDEYKESHQIAVKSLVKKTSEIEKLTEEIPLKEKGLCEDLAALDVIREEEVSVTDQLNKISGALSEKRQSAQAFKSKGRVLDFLMQQKSSGKLAGILGRLGDLGGIEAKYDVAISTACGPLDHIVVDTVRTAKEAVDALKKHDVGRANFIALEKVAWLQNVYTKPLTTPENVPRLFDLISCKDSRVLPAFYFGLRDTLVTDELEQGKRVAYGTTRFRVVTLDGEIIELAGTMSGGGRTKLRGRMGRNAAVIESSPGGQDLARMEQSVKRLEANLAGVVQKRALLEDSISLTQSQLKQKKDSYKTISMEIKELKKQIDFLKTQITLQEKVVAKVTPDKTILSEKQAKVDQLKTELDAATVNSQSIEEKLKKINDGIEASYGTKVKEAKKKLDALKKKIQKISQEITKANVAISTSEREAKKTRSRIESSTVEITKAEEKLNEYKNNWEKLNKEEKELSEQIEEVSNKIFEAEESINKLKNERKSEGKRESQIKSEVLSVEENFKKISKEINYFNSKIPALQEKLKNLKLHVVPGDDLNDTDEGLKKFSDEELSQMLLDKIKYQISGIEEKLKVLKYDPAILKEYELKVALCEERAAELQEANNQRHELQKAHLQLRKNRLNEFMTGFVVICNKLKEVYQMITFGGDAEFELFDSMDPFEGVNFSVRPPKKAWKNISNLSGGEKTLASLALVFALHYYKPSPLYIMDEIDAALDFRNVTIVGHYIKDRTKNSQFIVISLRSNMFELADVLVGIYKTHNRSKSTTISTVAPVT